MTCRNLVFGQVLSRCLYVWTLLKKLQRVTETLEIINKKEKKKKKREEREREREGFPGFAHREGQKIK